MFLVDPHKTVLIFCSKVSEKSLSHPNPQRKLYHSDFFLVIMHLSNKVSIKIEICCVLWGSQFSFTNSMRLNDIVSERRNKAYKNLAEASKHLHHLQWPTTTFEIERKFPHKPQFYKPHRGGKNCLFLQDLLSLRGRMSWFLTWNPEPTLWASVYSLEQLFCKVSGMKKVFRKNYCEICVGGGLL